MTHDRPGIFRSYREALTTLLVWLCACAIAWGFYALCFYGITAVTAQAQPALVPGEAPESASRNMRPNPDEPAPGLLSSWDDDTNLDAARMCFCEASWNENDCAAQLWVILRRWLSVGAKHGWSYRETMHRYSSLWPPKSERHRFILSLEADWPISAGPAHAKRWRDLQRLARAFATGRVADPCRAEKPMHWGGRPGVDVLPARAVIADCTGGTANRFYR